MQKIDIPPSIDVLRACFRSESAFFVSFKGAIRVQAEPCVGELGWKLTRFKQNKETSWLSVNFEKQQHGWELIHTSNEPIVAGLAIGAWEYQEPSNTFEVYLAQLMTIYGGRVADITSIER